MTEMPGISPHVARFGRWVRDAGFTVYMPSLFGRDGAVPERRGGHGHLPAGMRQRRVPRLRRQRVEPGDRVAAVAGEAGARGVRRSGRRRDRDVLHRQLRAHDDARARDARAGAGPAVAAARRPRRDRDRARRARRGPATPRAGRPDRHGLPLRGRSVLHGAAVRGLLRGARRPLRRARASRQRGQPRHARRSSNTWWRARTAW